MDVQKTLSQAEQLFKRGKTQEAIEKYESVLFDDPTNEVAANKLALVYVSTSENNKAIQLYCDIAKRASEKGKSQKAIALYKQALSIDANNPKVLLGLVEESESIGKYSEAAKICEQLVKYFLPRKKYLDIIHVCSRWVKCDPRNEQAKIIWLDIVRVLADEASLTQALVVLGGPPGLFHNDQQVGGDPKNLSDKVLEKLDEMKLWFPSNPRTSYCLAWVQYKKENLKKTYKYLFETFNKDPDYTLGVLLFCRILSEQSKIEEAKYVYKYIKESITRDQKTGIKILTEQLNNFEKNNAWLSFSDGLASDSILNNEEFIKKIKNIPLEKKDEEKTEIKTIDNNSDEQNNDDLNIELPGGQLNNEINLSSNVTEEHVIEFNTRSIDLNINKITSELPISTDEESTTDENLVNGLFEKNNSIVLPDVTNVPAIPAAKVSTLDDSLLGVIQSEKELSNEETLKTEIAKEVSEEDQSTRTKLFSPQDLVQAVRWEKSIHAAEETKSLIKEELIKSKTNEESDNEYSKILTKTNLLQPKLQIPQATNEIQVQNVEDKNEISSSINNTVMFTAIPQINNSNVSNKNNTNDAKFYDSEANTMQILLSEKPVSELVKNPALPSKIEVFIQKGDLLMLEQDYYSARKMYRNALENGADLSLIKDKLKLVREKEVNSSLYQNSSTDNYLKIKDIQAIIHNLSLDFDINVDEIRADVNFRSEVKKIRENIESQLKDCDPKIRLDIGIAFYEMGLYEEAENQFLKINTNDDNLKFDSYYLAALAMKARANYLPAIDLLSKAIKDLEKNSQINLAIFYLMGELYEEASDENLSKKYFNLVSKIDSNYRNIRLKLGTR